MEINNDIEDVTAALSAMCEKDQFERIKQHITITEFDNASLVVNIEKHLAEIERLNAGWKEANEIALEVADAHKAEQKDIMEEFWMMIMECQSAADKPGESVKKHLVEQMILQWNRVMDGSMVPAWVELIEIEQEK